MRREWPRMNRVTRRRLLQSSVVENCSKMRMVFMCSMFHYQRTARRQQIHRSLATNPQGGAACFVGATPWPPRISMATQHPKGARAEDRRSHRYHCYYCNHRAPTTKMCRHRRIGPASVVMQGMHDRPLQTRSPHAFLRASQLELGRPSTSTFLQSQHCHASSSRTCHHGL